MTFLAGLKGANRGHFLCTDFDVAEAAANAAAQAEIDNGGQLGTKDEDDIPGLNF